LLCASVNQAHKFFYVLGKGRKRITFHVDIMIQDWTTITIEALQKTWQGFLNFIPNLLIAIIVFIIGYFFALGIGKLIAGTLIRLKFNKIFERIGWKEALEKAELKVNPSEFVGAIFKWILVIVFLLAVVEILGFVQFAVVLNKLIGWIPNLIVAVVIFVVAVIVADILDKIIRASVQKIGVKYVGALGGMVRWAIYIFAGLAILAQLKIEVANWIADLLRIAFAGVVIAGAIAFGLGGKDAAAKIIEDLRKKISE